MGGFKERKKVEVLWLGTKSQGQSQDPVGMGLGGV